MKLKIKMLQTGESGSGKTYNALSFPKCYYIVIGAGEEDTILCNANLKKNLVDVAELRPLDSNECKRMYDINNKRDALFCKAIDKARGLAKEGKVETLVIDNITFLAEYVWVVIDTFYPRFSDKKPDVKAPLPMFGDLARRMYQIIAMEISNFPGNVVVNVHMKVEDEKVLEKLPNRSNPIVADILGSIRNSVKGHFSLNVFLEKVEKAGQYSYFARTNMGNKRAAKSRYPLPTIIQDLTYAKIMQAIQQSIEASVK